MPPVVTWHDAERHLGSVDPVLGALIQRVGPCTLRPERARTPYQALVHAIAHQQLHARAAEAILGRLMALMPEHAFPQPAQVLALEDAALRSCGFSAAKIAALRDIADKTLSGLVPSRLAAARRTDAVLIEQLTSLRGVGRWTVEMLLIFTLGRPDILPVDDFGVREGFRVLHGLQVQPRPKELAASGQIWAPYRSIAAWYLWRAADEAKVAKKKKE